MLDRGQKIVGVVGGIISIGVLTVGVWVGAHGKADAREVQMLAVKQASTEAIVGVMAKQMDWMVRVMWQGRATEPPPRQMNMSEP